jgi:hypothetical protein
VQVEPADPQDNQSLSITNLGLELRRIRGAINANKTIPLKDCGVVVWCILAAWVIQVPIANLEEHIIQTRTNLASQHQPVALAELPPVLALG